MADMKLTFDPEMLEEWVTAEDAVEVASWHMAAGQGGGPAPAITAVGAASAAAPPPAATDGLSTPAPPPVLAPVLQGVNGPSAQEQGSLEYRIKLKEYEVQLQQLRILRSQLQSESQLQDQEADEAAATQYTPSQTPLRRELRVVHPVYTIPMSTYIPYCIQPCAPTPSARLNVIN